MKINRKIKRIYAIVLPMPWVLSSSSGGIKIPPSAYTEISTRVSAYASSRPWNSSHKLQLRFKGQFCYVDSVEKDGTICPLGRLRYFQMEKWGLALYTYSNERYEPCLLPKGMFGSLEEVISVCEFYLI